MITWIFKTVDSWGPTFLRLSLGAVMFPHGAQKLLGWWGGSGWTATMKVFTESMHIPPPLAMAAIITEFAGSICLILGLFTRFWAIGMGTLITVAAVKVHLTYGFFMNWTGKQKGEGYEYHLLVLGMSLALLFLGGGRLSLDGLLAGGGGKSSGREGKSEKVRLKD